MFFIFMTVLTIALLMYTTWLLVQREVLIVLFLCTSMCGLGLGLTMVSFLQVMEGSRVNTLCTTEYIETRISEYESALTIERIPLSRDLKICLHGFKISETVKNPSEIRTRDIAQHLQISLYRLNDYNWPDRSADIEQIRPYTELIDRVRVALDNP